MTHAAIEELTPPLEAIVNFRKPQRRLTILHILGSNFLLDVRAVAIKEGVVVIHFALYDNSGWWMFRTLEMMDPRQSACHVVTEGGKIR